jgi:hypothetical protein
MPPSDGKFMPTEGLTGPGLDLALVKLSSSANQHVLYCKLERLWIIYGVKTVFYRRLLCSKMPVPAMTVPFPVI